MKPRGSSLGRGGRWRGWTKISGWSPTTEGLKDENRDKVNLPYTQAKAHQDGKGKSIIKAKNLGKKEGRRIHAATCISLSFSLLSAHSLLTDLSWSFFIRRWDGDHSAARVGRSENDLRAHFALTPSLELMIWKQGQNNQWQSQKEAKRKREGPGRKEVKKERGQDSAWFSVVHSPH